MSIHKKFCLLLATLTFAGASFAQTPDVRPEHIHGESGVITRLDSLPGHRSRSNVRGAAVDQPRSECTSRITSKLK